MRERQCRMLVYGGCKACVRKDHSNLTWLEDLLEPYRSFKGVPSVAPAMLARHRAVVERLRATRWTAGATFPVCSALEAVARALRSAPECEDGWTPALLRGPGSLAELSGAESGEVEAEMERLRELGWIVAQEELPGLLWRVRVLESAPDGGLRA